MKFEMDFGYIDKEKITIETWDFDKIKIIQEFIAFQEENGWSVDDEAIECEKEVPAFALNAHEPL